MLTIEIIPTTAASAPPAVEVVKTHNRNRRRAAAQREYQRRKNAGTCGYFGCPSDAESRHTYCRKHLDKMAKYQRKTVVFRKSKGLCITCGERPQFWSLRCVICREKLAANPLPLGARKALRLYREAQHKLGIEETQARVRCAARKLLASGDVRGEHARALQLYVGLDADGRWRDGVEVGKSMGISRERVRQLLYPSKVILTEFLNGDVPWKPPTEKPSPTSQERSWREPKWARRRKGLQKERPNAPIAN